MTDLDPTSAPILQAGSGYTDWVTYLQQALSAGGFDPGPADGSFGSRTEQAVREMQQAAGLDPDGVVGPASWAALARILGVGSGGTGDGGDDAGTTGGSGIDPSGGRFDPHRAPLLRQGDSGDWVTYLQGLLADSGHDPGPIDGIFGPRTAAAVRAFQSDAAIDVDGIVGPQTWTALDPIAERHPSDPPYGSPVNHGGGGSTPGGGSSPGGGGAAGDTQLHISINPASQIVDGILDVTWTVTNNGQSSVEVIRLERSIVAVDGAIDGARDVGHHLDPGFSHDVVDGVPMGPAPGGESYQVTFRGSAVFERGDGVEHRSAEAQATYTVDDQGNVTAGGEPVDPGGSPGGATRNDVSVSITTADRTDDQGLTIYFPTANHSSVYSTVTVIEWSANSGGESYHRDLVQSQILGPTETATCADVAPLGPAPEDPYTVHLTAVAVYILDGDAEVYRSPPAQQTITIDGEGVVGGSARGGGGTDPNAAATAVLHLQVDVFCVDDVLAASATATNTGEGVADDVNVHATLSGPLDDHKVTSAASLPPHNGIVAEVGVRLPADRTETMLFVLGCGVESSNAPGDAQSTGVSVDPDGNVARG